MSEAGSSIQAMEEDIRSYLPDYSGYAEKDQRAKTDRLLREHLNQQIAALTSALQGAVRDLGSSSDSDVAHAIERVRRKLEVIADGLNESLAEAETSVSSLDESAVPKLYAYDLSILKRVAALRREVDNIDVRSITSDEEGETLTLLDDLVDGLSQDLFERDTLIEGQDEVEY